MKKVIVTLLVLISCSFITAETATLNLVGTVPLILNMNLTPTGETLDLTVDQTTQKTVATIAEESNSGTGYTITINSDFNFSNTNPTDDHPFVLYYDNNEIPTTNYQVVDSSVKSDGSSSKNIDITYDAVPANQTAGTYNATIQFVITAK